MNLNGFEIDEHNIYGIPNGATTSTCPICSEKRKTENRKQKCMSVFWDTGLGWCNHCGERVQLHTYKKKGATKSYVLPKRSPVSSPLSDVLVNYFKDVRGISLDTLRALKIGESKRWMPKAGSEISVIEFPYSVFGKVVNVKYRGKNKDFMFEKGCELVMFNLDAIAHEKECVIVEGEVDALSYVEAGIKNVVSVPNGFTLPKKDGTSSINLSFLDDYYSFFEDKEKIFLAVDNDPAGKHGEQELINRFGSEKCWKVDFKDCKDANEYLLAHGKEKLANTIKEAEQIPLEFVETLIDFEDQLDDWWINGSPKGYVTGMKNLDDNYSIEDGQFTVVTGPPQSGKSEFVDAMCIGYAMLYNIKTAFASAENKPNKLHADKIIRKISGFRPRTKEDVNSKRIKRAKRFYNEHFTHLEYNNGYDLTKVLAKFEELVHRKGVKCFVLDPYNKIKLKGASKDVNEYTCEYLTEIDSFCRKHRVFMILVAHPVKMQKEEGTETWQMPTAYNVKGGGEIYDMSYHMLGMVKDVERKLVKVKTLKVKFQHLGSPDVTFWFGWNINNGRYVSIDYDPVSPIEPVIVWDNGDYLLPNKEDEKEEIMQPYWPKTTELMIEPPRHKQPIDFTEPKERQLDPSLQEEPPF